MKVQEHFKNDVARAGVSTLHGMPVSHSPSVVENFTSLEVGVAIYPWLADHGFQDMTVLPGAFYIELALRIHIESLHATVGRIRQIEFRNPVILPESNTSLSVGARWLDDQTVQYTFREFGQGSQQPCATLEIECGQCLENSISPNFSPERLQQQATHVADFYHRLKDNGNQYGPQFQNLQQTWRSNDEALGQLNVSRYGAAIGRDYLDPIFVDSAVQILSSWFIDRGQTFILQGIEEITLFRNELPQAVWVHARLRSKNDSNTNSRTGDVDVFDTSGILRLKLHGVRFRYLNRLTQENNTEAPKTKIVVAANFTAEPIEDSLKFWGDHLQLPVQVDFAPYNQIFQELLNPASQMRQNKEGANVLLLNLDDWMTFGRANHLKMDAEKAAVCFANLERHTLPGGIEIAHLNRHETEYVYQEIFRDQCYLRHGIHLPDNAVVIDIGANIGLFSLFVRSHCPQALVYSYEPSPIAFQALKANCEAYGPRLKAFNAGVSEKSGSAALTFYGKSSVFSSFHPSAEEDGQAIRAVVANMVRGELGNSGPVDDYVDELMVNRLDRQTFNCPLVSVPDIIRDNHLPRVDLLKVDAEKCELEILRGMDDTTWQLIDQVVIEVHDRTRQAVEEVIQLLSKQGFHCAVEEEKFLTGSGLFNVYATRSQNQSQNASAELQDKVDEFVQAMESYARDSSTPLILCLCPSQQKNSALDEIENDLAGKLRAFTNVHLIHSKKILARYQTHEFHDPHANQLGHVPYTPEGFAAIGSSTFRTLASLRRTPFKVIVLDCDNTLWRGVCGEEGPNGVVVTPSHRVLQELMVRQMADGMLLCLCSKNNESDVRVVFEQNPEMVLKPNHFAASRINWLPKSENLKSLSHELNLGLDSFIFLDDNSLECAEVRAQCPQVLTLQLPPDNNQWPQFLGHIWAFDHLRATNEDRTRTQKVLENAEREKYREQVSTLKDFIQGLQLDVQLFVPVPDQLSRVSQLTLRTNQFNFTTIRRSESDITHFLDKQKGYCLAVKVSDRFGDYGMSGLLIYFENSDTCDVDTFLLSCRVLGRGVEHQVLAQFGQLARKSGKQWVKFHFRATDKNQPAWEFIKSIGAGFMQTSDTETVIQFPVETLASLRYDPGLAQTASVGSDENSGAKAKPRSMAALTGSSEIFQKIAAEWNDVKKICATIDLRKSKATANGASQDLPATLAGKILGIWRRVIGNPHVGMNDNFVDAGGTSLKAVQIVAAIRRELNFQLSIVNIFECPTVRLLSEKLEPPATSTNTMNEAMARGAKRRRQSPRAHA